MVIYNQVSLKITIYILEFKKNNILTVKPIILTQLTTKYKYN